MSEAVNLDWQATIQAAYRSFLAEKSIKPRKGQMQMIADLAKSFFAIQEDAEGFRAGQQADEHLIVIEAGTGTGKTLAYLLATLPIAQLKDKKLVISTATVALQEQLLNKDLPDLISYTDLDFSYALAKGRGRYLCTLQLKKLLDASADASESSSTFNLFEQEVLAQQPLNSNALIETLAEDYTSGKWDGDRDNLTTHPPAEVWARLTTDHQRCRKKQCPHFNDACPFYAARRELETADLIVANHDLVLADLALGGGKILPPPESTYYVFDEAHHLANKALNHFSASFRFNASLKWLNLLKKNLPDLQKAFPSSSFSRPVNEISGHLAQLETDLGQGFEYFSQLVANTNQYVFKLDEEVSELNQLVQNLAGNFSSLFKHLDALTQQLVAAQDPDKNTGELSSEEAEKWQPSLALLASRAQSAAELWQLFQQPKVAQGSTPLAKWINQQSLNQGDEEIEVNASPVSAAESLNQQLWQSCYGAALTSATLTALGKFDRLHLATGLSASTPSRVYPSPFNYAELGVIEVPPRACDPRNSEEHTQAIVKYLSEAVDLSSVAGLVLFTSRRQMQEVHELLPDSVKKITFTQDELPKTFLLERHKKRIDQQQPSLLFGLASLAEGIDLPGDYLTHLIITRLPFASPDDPIEATLAQWLETQGRKPFFEISVPDASIRLIQACGRLIRTETDRGKITLLDRRLLTQRYGRDLLNSLPPFRRDF